MNWKMVRKFLTAMVAGAQPMLYARITDLWAWGILLVSSFGAALGIQAATDAVQNKKANQPEE